MDEVKRGAERARALAFCLRRMLIGHTAEVVGAALGDVISVYIALHPPNVREEELNALIQLVREMIPIAEEDLFPNGLPEGWRQH